MCNVSVSDDIIKIPQSVLLVPAGPANLCQCVLCVCGLGLPAVIVFYLPPLPGEFQPGICQSVDPSSSTHCNCHPATTSHRYSPSLTLILSLILVLVAS
ncbi:unnamed protein product [Staurois parvus]|uniref:Uncharacterized protein n=1 Tax=Staurois parvus TaxID=386267 RepID=A0ABN9EK15_9NEOB|nr:unnamed protein product [Staurois parvus]